jgi:hypothetical protein
VTDYSASRVVSDSRCYRVHVRQDHGTEMAIRSIGAEATYFIGSGSPSHSGCSVTYDSKPSDNFLSGERLYSFENVRIVVGQRYRDHKR